MLKALELIGFKSFAGKTRFEFPSGITAVVGPNGSGKSNIVDAVKWVLGEQSVKSLRGKEMADVIFNGSGTRRPMNSAEITLTFDNSAQLLDVDTPEVHITRRVYRSGEGEYLINRQPCRLRDIRDLLSGTGMGTQAYSIIEQGKVDVLLQASAKDRRMIFEEAAGISRFKAKKVEALRRLDRVEQNLLRLSDIVDEVDNRLRNVRAQAGKARRYREHTSRLQELRTQVGLVDWRRLTEKLVRFDDQVAALATQRDAAVAEAEGTEARLLEAETRAGQIHEEIRAAEARISANRERIAGHESTIQHERERCGDLDEELAQHRRQVAAMSHRAGDLDQQLRDTGAHLLQAEEQHRQVARAFAEGERFLTELMARLDQARSQLQQCRSILMEKMRATAVLGNQISGLESRVVATAESRLRCDQRLAELGQHAATLNTEAAALDRRRCELETHAAECREKLLAAEDRAQQLAGDL
ncbi:MAG: chromosome segregation SMC family protein, partial [Thermoguttaceae bacterium]